MRYARIAAPIAAVALVLAGSAAQADPVDVSDWVYECIDGTEWDVYAESDWGFGVNDAYMYADAACEGSAVNGDAFDDAWFIWLANEESFDYYGEDFDDEYIVDRTVAANGDVVFTGPVEALYGLNVQVEIRLYAAGDMVRTLATYTNPTAAPITVDTGTQSFFGSGDDTEYHATSSGDAAAPTTDDNWAVSGDIDFIFDPMLLNAWQLADAPYQADFVHVYDHDELWTEGELTVAPGETVRLAYFSKIYGFASLGDLPATDDLAAAATIDADPEAAVATAIAGAAEFASFAGRLTAGLAAGTEVLNWGTVAAAPPATPVPGRPSFTG